MSLFANALQRSSTTLPPHKRSPVTLSTRSSSALLVRRTSGLQIRGAEFCGAFVPEKNADHSRVSTLCGKKE